jgi:hypothetical protein
MDFKTKMDEAKLLFSNLIKNKIFVSSLLIFFVLSATATYLYVDYKNN